MLLLDVLNGKATESTPVWMMRQAGRYLPEYIELRKKYSFFERVETPELACEITMQPIRRLGVDAAILFSDILVIPQAMGYEVQLIEQKGPVLPTTFKEESQLANIPKPDAKNHLHYVLDAIKLIRKELDGKVPLIGFAGAPWTIFCYMVEGKGSKDFHSAKRMFCQNPTMAHAMMQSITDHTIDYLNAQIEAGAQAVQLFDSWAGLLSQKDFNNWALPYIKQIVAAVTGVPFIVFAKGAWHSLNAIAETGCQAQGVDWCCSPEFIRSTLGEQYVIQGNFDPSRLMLPVDQIEKEVHDMIDGFGGKHLVANLGHGILPTIPVEHAQAFVHAVQSYKQK